MRLILLGILSFIAVPGFAQERVAPIEIRGNIGVVSDYVFRGISQSDEDPVLQGGIDFILGKGFYAGVWASGVDTPWGGVYNQVPDVEDFEYDIYAGWQWAHSSGNYKIDTGLIQYAFDDDPDDLTWSEFYFSVSLFRKLRLKASTDIDGIDFGTYYEASFRQPLANNFDVTLHAGYYDLQDRVVRDMEEYSDMSISLGKFYKGFRFELTYHRTDRDARARYLDVADDRVVLTLKRDFELFPNFRVFQFN